MIITIYQNYISWYSEVCRW